MLLLVFGLSPLTRANVSFLHRGTDVVQVDTGNVENFTGTLELQSNCLFRCWHPHGTWMAEALADEVSRHTNRTVFAKQIIWTKGPEGVAKAILEALEFRPRVIALSLSGSEPNQAEYLAISRANEEGVLVLAAAGNQGRDRPQYPAAYDLPCLLAVSTSIERSKDPIANTGDIYFPKVHAESGTSYSTARMSAVAAAYFQKHTKATCLDATRYLLKNHSLHTSP